MHFLMGSIQHSDGNGLNDGLEVTSLGTNPTLSDTDDNRTPDGSEDYDGD